MEDWKIYIAWNESLGLVCGHLHRSKKAVVRCVTSDDWDWGWIATAPEWTWKDYKYPFVKEG